MSIAGKIGGVAVAYYVSTTILATILGLSLVSIIRPGVGKSDYGPRKEGQLHYRIAGVSLHLRLAKLEYVVDSF